jgi:hypothetical protein
MSLVIGKKIYKKNIKRTSETSGFGNLRAVGPDPFL